MFRKPLAIDQRPKASDAVLSWIVVHGVLIGLVTGLMGAGPPALILFQKLLVKEAIGTSVVIITVNSMRGFIGTHDKTHINWPFLILISILAITGILIGIWVSKRIDPSRLTPMFGWFVLVMEIYIILKETLF